MTDEERNASQVYVVRKPCGCIIGISAIDHADKNSLGEWIAENVRAGLGVDRTTFGAAKSEPTFFNCEHEPSQLPITVTIDGVVVGIRG